MEIIRSIKQMQQYILAEKQKGKKIGFVPTMGFLHEGHEKLIRTAREDNDITITSIFVNPLQFGPNEDFDRYPRDEEHDVQVCKRLNVDVLFLPDNNEMYPKPQVISIHVDKRTDALCGRSREGHFSGVATVLTKLFHIVSPDQAYFGMKDAQQVAVVEGLIHDFNFPITIVPVQTIREEDGLAKSSRNVYLSAHEREEAPIIFKALQLGQKMVIDGEKNPDIIVREVESFITSKTSGKIDYVELLSYPDLTAVETINETIILATAVHFKKARLIDNIVMNADGSISVQI
ncbi:pantoate--beta-alanine ligase [Aquibacillus kalidii]|uniref:pantoate--beta-alanine ligase n=1 Tax=Aquibacillus kalidii TaxID=2762597 RepID=UPI001648D3F6|nr:pantoate--beta-alanine ligase [Aquibacillus kalidii]